MSVRTILSQTSRPYKIEIYGLQDNHIGTLQSYNDSFIGQVVEPLIEILDDGSQSFTCSIPKFYIDPETLLKELSIGTKVKLKAEPTNPYDSHAIAILFRDKNIGYIPKKDIPIITINIPETGGEAYICKLENKLIGISIKATFERLNSKIAKEFGSFYFYKNTTKYTKEGEITRHQMLKQEEFIKLVNEQTLIIY